MALPERLLTTSKLSIGYRPETAILRDLRLVASSGQLTAILGKNGIGKSTLLKTLANLLPPIDGEIRFGNQVHGTIPTPAFSRLCSFVPSKNIIAGNFRVREFVAFGRSPHTNWTGKLTDKDQALVETSLERTNLCHLAEKRIQAISDGELQRTLLARALAQDTPFLFLDEPVAFLDLPNKVAALRLLNQIAREDQKTILLSIHDFDLAVSECDHIWLLTDQGCPNGAPEDLARAGFFDQLFNRNDLIFDPETFRFFAAGKPRKPIQLSPALTGDPYVRHALVRAGFLPSASHEETHGEWITMDWDGLHYSLKGDRLQFSAPTIAAAIEELKEWTNALRPT